MSISSIEDETAYRVEIRVKNNLIITRIKKAGFNSVAAFARKYNLCHTHIGTIINFKRLPIKINGDWIDVVYDLSSALQCEPEDLFTERQKTLIARRNHVVEMSEIQFMDSLQSFKLEKQIEDKDYIKKLSATLTPTQIDIIDKRIKENMSFEEIGNIYNVSKDRIRQIEDVALRKMKKQVATIGAEQRNLDDGIIKPSKQSSD